jgi:two-component system, chemotaxis family, chemotaxis protein CheY
LAERKAPEGKSLKIMVVDDSQVVRTVVKQALSMAGYTEVIEAADGVEALSLAKARPAEVGLYVLDVNMPAMDGITLVGELRKLTQDVPIIMLTTETDKGKMGQAKDLGATGWIVKPFDADKFIKVVEMFVKR